MAKRKRTHAAGAATDDLGRPQKNARRRIERYQESVRQSPGTSLIYALAFGFIVRLVPIVAVLRLASALARPAILIFGAVKLLETLQRDRAG